MLAILIALPATALAVTVAPPRGSYGVTRQIREVTDTTRSSPFGQAEDAWRSMISIYQPTWPIERCRETTEPYMPPSTALAFDALGLEYGIPNGTFGSIENVFCEDSGDQAHLVDQLVLFSPALGQSRVVYGLLATALASQGFTVVTIDHPLDALRSISRVIVARQQDIGFIVNETLNGDSILIRRLYRPKVLVAGHSLGGATAIAAMMEDSRILGGVNLDGTVWSPFVDRGIRCPFMLVGTENNTPAETSWARLWSYLKSTRIAVGIRGTAHGSFTDFPFLAEELGLTANAAPELEAPLGVIDGTRAFDVVVAYVSNFFRFALGTESLPLPARSSKALPEVLTLRGEIRGHCSM